MNCFLLSHILIYLSYQSTQGIYKTTVCVELKRKKLDSNKIRKIGAYLTMTVTLRMPLIMGM